MIRSPLQEGGAKNSDPDDQESPIKGSAEKPDPNGQKPSFMGIVGWGWCMPRNNDLPFCRNNALDIFKHCVIPGSRNHKSALLEKLRAHCMVSTGIRMFTAVKLDDDLPCQTDEIENEISIRMCWRRNFWLSIWRRRSCCHGRDSASGGVLRNWRWRCSRRMYWLVCPCMICCSSLCGLHHPHSTLPLQGRAFT